MTRKAVLILASALLAGGAYGGSIGVSYDSSAEPTDGYLLGWNATTKRAVGVEKLLDKLDATTAPTADDDSGDGYSVGSIWIDVTGDTAYLCVDATVASAVWQEIGAIGAVLADGTVPLTANWDAGAFEIRAETFESDVATGTAPFTIGSTTVSTNLNADLLDGEHASAFEDADATLSSLALLGTAADKMAYTTGVDTWAEATLTAFGRSILDDADEATFKATVNLEAGTDFNAFSAYLADFAAMSPVQGNIAYFDGSDWVVLAPGTDGYFLKAHGAAANPTWAAVSATPGGADTNVQYNDSGAFGGESGMTYNATTDTLTLGGGIALGNNTDTTDGTVRWTGSDLEVYDSGWVSLTAGATGGEANTMSSAGSGVSLYYQKSALDLQVNAIKSENDRLSVSLDSGTHDVELTVNEGYILVQNLGGTQLTHEKGGLEADVSAYDGLLKISGGTTSAAVAGTDYAATRSGVHRTVWVDAGAFVARVTNGMAAATEEYATNDVMSDHYLADATTSEAVQFRIVMPDVWDRSTVKVKVFWDAASGASASDQVSWQVRAAAVGNDDAIDGAWGTAVTLDDVVIAVGDLHATAASAALTVGGTPALGDVITWEVSRNVAGNDDMTEDAKFLGIQIQYAEGSTEPSAW